jgi:hypothetical protein
MERKPVAAFSVTESSDHGNGVAALIVILCGGRSAERNPEMVSLMPLCSRNGIGSPLFDLLPVFESHLSNPTL